MLGWKGSGYKTDNMKKIIALASLLLGLSCTRETTEGPFVSKDTCDCKGKASVVVQDRTARITERRTLLLNDVNEGEVAYRELVPCDTSKISGLPTSKEGVYGYSVSGELRPPCVTNGVAYFWSFNLTSIRKK